MDKIVFLSILALLAVIYFIVGYITSRGVKTVEDYFLAGRKLTVFQLSVSIIATQLGGGLILGTSQKAYSMGFYGLLYVIGICCGCIILASGLAGKLRLLNVETTAQLFEIYYNSKLLRKIASLCSILSLVGIFAAQIVGSKALMTGLSVYNPLIFILFWFSIILYAMLGGLKAIVKNDIFQLSFIIVVFVGIFIADLLAGPQNILSSINLLGQQTHNATISWSTILLVPLMPALYCLIEQDMAQLFFAALNTRIALVAAWAAALFLLLFSSIPLYFGIKAKLLGITFVDAANPLISLFDQTYAGSIVTLVVYGVLAAIISTANGVLCAISSNIVQDFLLDSAKLRSQLYISRIVMLLVGCAGLFLSFYCTDLIELLVKSYAIPVTALLVSLLVIYLSNGHKLSRLAAHLSVFGGLAAFGFLSLSNISLLTAEIDALAVSAVCYLIGYIIDCKEKTKKVY